MFIEYCIQNYLKAHSNYKTRTISITTSRNETFLFLNYCYSYKLDSFVYRYGVERIHNIYEMSKILHQIFTICKFYNSLLCNAY